MKLAFIFPGQGSQAIGMGKSLYDEFPAAKEVYDLASDALGYDIAKLSFEGPREELDKTFRTQPALLTASVATHRCLGLKGIVPSVVAGHSLGEYSALVAAGVLEFTDAVKLTEKRGTFMQDAVPAGKGLMAAILGLDRDKVDSVCLSVTSGYVAPANYNCPGQIVIAGEKQAVEEAIKLAKEAGAKRAVPLAVSVPSHSTLMVEASGRLAEELKNVPFHEPAIPIVNNSDAMFLNTTDSIKACLVKQLDSPLLWEDSMRVIIESGVSTFIEAGPGKVLSGLLKRIDSSVTCFNVEDVDSLEKTVKSLGK